MKIKRLKDGRWQVRRDDGVCFSLTSVEWQEVARETRAMDRAAETIARCHAYMGKEWKPPQ